MKETIAKLVRRESLTRTEARETMSALMRGEATPSQFAAILVALSMKGETVEEITGFAEAMRAASRRIRPRVSGRLVDTSGTGGAPTKTFNFSTLAAFVAAGAGVPVAKHGNRSATGVCGSADVLEALGARLDLSPERAQEIVEEVGVGFLFAPAFHPATRHAVAVRKELGVRTVFNLLGPLTTPAEVQGQVVGVCAADLVEPVAHVLGNLGTERALVVHGGGGVDEFSTLGESLVADVEGKRVTLRRVHPREFGITLAKPGEVGPLAPPQAASEFRRLLSGAGGPRREMMLLNAAAAIVAGGRAATLGEGIEAARESVDSSAAERKLAGFLQLAGAKTESSEHAARR